MDTWRLTARELQRRLVGGEVTVREVVTDHLARIASVDGAFASCVVIDEERAVRHADRLDGDRRAGRPLGPLHGVPVVIKDSIDVAGLPTRLGSPLRADAAPAPEDSEAVARLRRAGAVVLAKTATHELAAGVDTPGTNNPWEPGRSAGGSSGGSAAAVAAHLACGALGTDALGSVRIPAAYCGVVGLKPTYGRVPTGGSHPLSWSLDHIGAFARTVDDTRMLAVSLLGDERSPASSSRNLGVPVQLLDGIGEDAAATLDRAVSVVEDAGFAVRELDLPDLRDAVAAAYALCAPEAATVHRRAVADHGSMVSDGVRSLLLAGLGVPAVTYLTAQQVRRHLADVVRRAFEEHDLAGVLAPAAPGAAHRHGERRTSPGGDPITIGCVRPNAVFNLTGQPSLVVPVGLDADGLPLAVQVATRPDDEAGAFAVGEVLEGAAPDLGRRRAALA